MGNYVFFKSTWKKIFPLRPIPLILADMRRVQKDSPAGTGYPLGKIYVDLRISDSLFWRRDIQMLQTHPLSVVMPTMNRRFFKVPSCRNQTYSEKTTHWLWMDFGFSGGS
jgi:hypothetical protein